MGTLLYKSNSPPQTLVLPNCAPVPQHYPALLPASLDWPLEEKELLPDPIALQVSVCSLIPVCVWCDLNRGILEEPYTLNLCVNDCACVHAEEYPLITVTLTTDTAVT